MQIFKILELKNWGLFANSISSFFLNFFIIYVLMIIFQRLFHRVRNLNI